MSDDAPDSLPGRPGPFGHRAFRQVWVISASFQFSYWFFIVTVQWLVAQETANSPGALGIVYFAALSPLLIFSLHAGALLDRFNMRRIFTASQIFGVVLTCTSVGFVLLGWTQPWVLTVFAFGVGLTVAVANPAAISLTALSVPPEDLARAIPLQTIAMNVARTAGPAGAGILIATHGPASALVASAAMGALALVTLLRLRPVRAQPSRSVRAATSGEADHSIAAGINHARSRPPSGLAITLVAASVVFGASYLAQLPAIAAQVSASSVAFIALTTAGGVGSLVGVVWVALRRGAAPTIRIAVVAALALGLSVVAMAFSSTLAVSIVVVGLAGAFQFIVSTVSQFVVQSSVDDEFRGRVMSAFTLAWGGMMPVGGLMLGLTMVLVGVERGLLISGVVLVIAAGWAWRRSRPAEGSASAVQ